MDYPVITNYNYTEIQDYRGPKPKGYWRDYGIHRNEEGNLVFTANYLACPCIYYVIKDDKYCFSFDVDSVVDFAKKEGIELTDTFDNLNQISDNIRKHIKSSILKRYKYNVNYIENWSEVILYSNGTFNKKQTNTTKPFSYEVADNYNIFKQFILKYKKYIDSLIDEGLYIPTLTGGLDSRALLGFCRDRLNELDGYFLTAVKQDGKNNVEQGQLEMNLAKNVANIIGLKDNRYNQLEDVGREIYTLTGMFNENSDEYKDPNDTDYIYKYMQHGYSNKYQYFNKITIYMDDDYLQFRQHNEMFRLLMIFIMTPDLVNSPFISGTSLFNYFPKGAYIYPFLDKALPKTNYILNSWGKDKINTLFIPDNVIDSGKPYLKYIETDIVNRCNLNCKGCGHMSPLYKDDTWEKDPKEFEEELKIISDKFSLEKLRIMGGEPLLHSNWMEMLRIARRQLPDTNIWLVTNGILLNKVFDNIEEINKLKVGICVSKYDPIKIDLNKFNSIKRRRILDKPDFYKLNLDINGGQDSITSFSGCDSKNCIQLRNGRLYRCPEMLHFNKLNEVFNTGLKVNLKDISIDINEESNKILEFINHNNIACKYCMINKRNSSRYTWDKSKLQKEEWIGE